MPRSWWAPERGASGGAATDYDALAGAVAVGHVLECGAQTTGGNYSFFSEVPGLEHPGFPLAELAADGSAVITKHPGTGGLVSVGTVTAQLLYEIGGPLYANPDVTADFSTIELDAGGRRPGQAGRREGADPPPSTVEGVGQPPRRVAQHHDLRPHRPRHRGQGGSRDAHAARDAQRTQRRYRELDLRLVRTDRPDAPSNEQASAQLRVTVKDGDADKVGRRFSRAVTELALSSYPGFYLTSPPGDASAYGVFWPTLVPPETVDQVVVHGDGRRVPVPVSPPDTVQRAARVGRPGAPSTQTPSRCPVGCRRAPATGAPRHHRGGPFGRQGRQRQRRAVGEHRRRLPVAARGADRRPPARRSCPRRPTW